MKEDPSPFLLLPSPPCTSSTGGILVPTREELEREKGEIDSEVFYVQR